jgi:hypothetical protein
VAALIDLDQADFGDAVDVRRRTGRFQVQKNQRAVKHCREGRVCTAAILNPLACAS